MSGGREYVERLDQGVAAAWDGVTERLRPGDGFAALAAFNGVMAGANAAVGNTFSAGFNGVLAGGCAAGAFAGDYPDRLKDPARRGLLHKVDIARREMVAGELDEQYVADRLDALLADSGYRARVDAEAVIADVRETVLEADPTDILDEADPLALADRPVEQVVYDMMDAAIAAELPTPYRDGAAQLYSGDDLHPDAVYRDVLAEHARFVRDCTADTAVGEDALAQLEQTSDRAELDDIAAELRSAADIQPTRLDGDEREAYCAARDHNHQVLDRLRPADAVDILDEEWGTGDMPYDVYEIADAGTLQTAAQEVGTCRQDYDMDYFEDVIAEDGTVVLGVHRHDDPGWAGFARGYLVDARETARPWLALDTLELRYRDGREGHHPHSACDFAGYGDVPIVEALAGMRYALDNDLAGVLSADGRVVGGDDEQYDRGDSVGPRHIYGGNSDAELWLQKQGDAPRRPYAFNPGIAQGAPFSDIDILFEAPTTDYDTGEPDTVHEQVSPLYA